MYVRNVCGLAGVLLAGASALGNTLFVGTYDGDTGNAGLDAAVAVGNPVAASTGSAFADVTDAKFGPSSLNPIAASSGGNALTYETAGNFVMNSTSAGTIEMWVKTTIDPAVGRQSLLTMYQPGFVGTVDLQIFTGNPGPFGETRIRAVLDTFSSGGDVYFQDSSILNFTWDNNVWHHVAWNWDLGAATPYSTLYIDGVAESFGGFGTLQYPGTVGTTFEVGSWQGGFDPLLGRIDDVRISDTAVYGQVASFTPPTESFVPFVATLAGDLNSDGFVGIADLNIVLGNWNQNVPPGDPLADVAGGGLLGQDPDGFVGIADLNTVLGNWNAGTPPPPGAAVPEPGALAILGVGFAALLRRKGVERF
jgi:Concanavalin A-like lectin/glucanases superfamily/PEP-CTERM motif